MKIDIWSDIACPWCYIGKRRLEAALADFDGRDTVQIEWHSYQLDPSLPERYDGTEADYLVQRKSMPREKVDAMMNQVANQARAEGLDYDFDRLVVANSLPAHRLMHLVKRVQPDETDTVKEALLKAHFVDGVDISDPEQLIRIGELAGLDVATVSSGLAAAEVAAAVEHDFAKARLLGIRGVPFFVFDDKYAISGAQPVEVFTEVLAKTQAESEVQVLADGDACGPEGCTT